MIPQLLKSVYFSPAGRISRSVYWLFSLPLVLVYYLFGYHAATINRYLFLSVIIAIGYMGIMICIKRCHDRGRSGYFTLILLVPVLSLWPTIELGFVKGTTGTNNYGADPLKLKRS